MKTFIFAFYPFYNIKSFYSFLNPKNNLFELKIFTQTSKMLLSSTSLVLKTISLFFENKKAIFWEQKLRLWETTKNYSTKSQENSAQSKKKLKFCVNLSSTGSPRPVIPQDGNGYGMNIYNSLGGNDFYSRVNQTGKDDQSKQQTSKNAKKSTTNQIFHIFVVLLFLSLVILIVL